MGAGRKVILYELNEVHWTVLDFMAQRRPDSHIARAMRSGRCETTFDHEDVHLAPWVTWPSFHTGLPASQHNSQYLGQDPATFHGDTIWDSAEAAGLKIGVFGPLQSWPARPPRHGGFYVSDTFSRDAQTYPASLSRFQAFNLAMTKEQGFSSDRPLSARALAAAGVDLLVKGITTRSIAMIAAQLFRERRDARNKAGRAIFQALPAFDLYWRLHRRMRPDLSIFFTNHLASMMHRYYGDAMPGYASEFDYEPDEVFATFVPRALDVADQQIGKLMRFVDANEDTVLIVAASMGQMPVQPGELGSGGEVYVVRDVERLAEALEFGRVEPTLAMYPAVSLQLPSEEAARETVAPLESVRTKQGDTVFREVTVAGRSVKFEVSAECAVDASRELTYTPRTNGDRADVASIDALGIDSESRLGGSNTAYHCPDGPMLTYGAGVDPDPSRSEVDLFDVAGRILELLGIRN